MKIRVPKIMSDEKISISEMIIDDELYNSGWIFSFYSVLEKRNNSELDFKENKFFWQYGVFLKRYFEVPIHNWSKDVDGFLSKYLEKDYYVILYSNCSIENSSNEHCVLFYDSKRTKHKNVYSCCKWENYKVSYFDGGINDIRKEFIDVKFIDLTQARFDLLRTGKEEFDYNSLDISILKSDLNKRHRIGFLDLLFSFFSNIFVVEKNLVILKEWFEIFLLRKKYLSIIIEGSNNYESKFRTIFASNLNLRLKLIKLLLLYKKLLKQLERCLENEESFTM